MRVGDLFPSLPSPHVRVHHLPDDRAWPNDGNLDNEIVKLLRAIPRQRCHLRATLHLKHADGVCLLQHFVDVLIFRQLGQIDSVAVVLAESTPDNP